MVLSMMKVNCVNIVFKCLYFLHRNTFLNHFLRVIWHKEHVPLIRNCFDAHLVMLPADVNTVRMVIVYTLIPSVHMIVFINFS